MVEAIAIRPFHDGRNVQGERRREGSVIGRGMCRVPRRHAGQCVDAPQVKRPRGAEDEHRSGGDPGNDVQRRSAIEQPGS